MIRAQATVDRVMLPGESHLFNVHVSDPSHEHRREYTIIANDEDQAAREGLRRFQAELDPDPQLDL